MSVGCLVPILLHPRIGGTPSILTPYSARSEAPYDLVIVYDPGTDNDSLYLASLWWVIQNPAGQYDLMILYSPGSLHVIVEVTSGDCRVILEPITHGAGHTPSYTFEESFDECDWLSEVNEGRFGPVLNDSCT
jgi:hypothetical protein